MGIRANIGLAEIEVNDKGDKISFSISDNNFLKKFSDFVEWFSKADKEIGKKNTEKESDNFEAFGELVEAQEALSNQALEKLEKMFGEGTCEKIFGKVSPTFVCVTDVIYQLSGEIEKIANEHNQYFASKYNCNRKAGRGK